MKKDLLSVYASRRHRSVLISILFCLLFLTVLSNFSIGQTPEERFFYRGINIGPDETSLVIDGNAFHPMDNYGEDFIYSGKSFENQSIALNPTTDANRARLIRSCLYSTKTTPANFGFYGIAPGDYDIYIYVWEDNNPSTFSIKIGGDVVVENYNSGGKGKWAKLGPFRGNAFRGELGISAFGGDANISAIELWKIEEESKPVFERALNLNSSTSLEIEGKTFEGSKTAEGFSYLLGRSYENQTLPLTPMPEANLAKMLRSCLYSTEHGPAAFAINTQFSGQYQVYLYTWEDNYSSSYSLKINNTLFISNANTGESGTWKKLGPFLVATNDSKITIEAYGGDFNLSGVEIYLFSFDPDAFSLTALSSQGIENASISASPNPLTNQLTVNIPSAYNGKVIFTLLDSYGKVYMTQNKKLDKEETYEFNLSSIQLPSGLYILRVKTDSKEERIRLIKE